MVPVVCRMAGEKVEVGEGRRVSNLSLGGVRIYSDERLDIGQELELEFFLPNGVVVKASARVVWSKELPPGSQGVYDVGLEFLALSKRARKELSHILEP